MDFIERMFGISPDGGNGSTELMIIAVFILIAVIATWWSKTSRDKISRP